MAEERVKSAAEMNAAVLRITGIKRAVLEDKKDVAAGQRLQEVSDRPDPGPEHKSFAPRETNSINQKVPKHEMPPKKPDEKQPGVGDYDDEEDVVAKPEQGAKKESIMNVIKGTGLRDMSEWRMLAGLTPMYESAERGTGEVPTAGAKKTNKMKSGGLPGLEGQSVQEIQPEESFDDGADAEETFDPAIGDLKKEDYNRHFDHFLEQRGLTKQLFNQLVDEAMKSGDVAEMDALIAVEGIFGDWMKKRSGGAEHQKNMDQLKKTKKAVADRKAGKVDMYGKPVSLRAAKAGVGKKEAAEEFTFEADDDGTGNPDWKTALASMKRSR